MQRLILEVGYQKYLVPNTVTIDEAVQFVDGLVPLEGEYVGGEYLYFPTKENGAEARPLLISDKNLREPTPEEKENDKISTLKRDVTWRDGEIKKLKDQVELLACKARLEEKDKQ